MKKQIRLEANGYGKVLGREPFLMADNEELTLEIASDYNALYLISLKNGDAQAQLTAGGAFRVPPELISEGMLEIEAAIYQNGDLFKKWKVEPIRIIKHEASFEWSSILDEINARLDCVADMKEQLNKFGEKLNKAEETMNEVAELVYDPLN